MAILNSQPDVEVTVLVEDTPAIEYDEDDPDLLKELPAATIVKYIEAASGMHFSFKLRVLNSFNFTSDGLSYNIYVDGKICDKPIIESAGRVRISTGATHRSLVDYVQKYKFEFVGIVETDREDPRVAEDRERIKDWGKIEVSVYRVQKNGYLSGDTVRSQVQSSKLGNISEKAVKGVGLTHGVFFSEIERTAVTWWDSSYPDGKENPFATFIFRYRSKRALHGLRILSTPQYTSMLTPEELREEYIREMGGMKRVMDHTTSPWVADQQQPRGQPVTIVIDDSEEGE